MPEGDTLHTIAGRLAPALEGATLTAVSLPRVRGRDRLRVGDEMVRVGARGKWLEIETRRGAVLRTHLRMNGRWELHRGRVPTTLPRHLLRASLATDDTVAVCLAAPTVAVGRRGDGALDHLGPDLCVAPVDLDAVLRRVEAWADPRSEIADVLLEQRFAAGIGNVYKSESLFACGVSPFRRLEEVDPVTLRALYDTAARQLQANVGRDRRVTFGDGLGVYGRAGQGCRRCGTGIRTRAHGHQGRSTWWCPSCQPD